ncbi:MULTISPECIES: ROK family protein [Actinomadura]|uniref:ROK family protein n=1 Tax=Actinomadura yumaensis TaxID=111807 RepID=A0ABW2CWY1_9ACTN|nr:ROK family protein [Actinomadura sp. J1-007]MWK36310.1 ROK family protein [Actinomadura sp. J1-007]
MTVVALDVGGTSMKGALIAPDGTALHTEDRPTPRPPEAAAAAVVAFAADLAARADGVTAAGIAVPGLVDEATGTAVYSANIGWRDVPFGALVSERLGVPVALGHDVRTGGLGEAARGAGRGAGDFLFLPIGTGIAAALVLGGAPYPGASGWSGEIGHTVVRPGGEPCTCGNRGCLEAYASAAGVSRRHAALTGADVPAEEVVRRALAGDGPAARVWDEALDALADSLATATLMLDPALVVVGGGLAKAGDALLGPLAERFAARLLFRAPPPVVPALLGDRAAVHGAAVLAASAR